MRSVLYSGGERSTEDRFLTWLVFEHALLLLKVLVHVIIPDQPASLAIIKARQRWVVASLSCRLFISRYIAHDIWWVVHHSGRESCFESHEDNCTYTLWSKLPCPPSEEGREGRHYRHRKSSQCSRLDLCRPDRRMNYFRQPAPALP